jgi:hypothetical protein
MTVRQLNPEVPDDVDLANYLGITDFSTYVIDDRLEGGGLARVWETSTVEPVTGAEIKEELAAVLALGAAREFDAEGHRTGIVNCMINALRGAKIRMGTGWGRFNRSDTDPITLIAFAYMDEGATAGDAALSSWLGV